MKLANPLLILLFAFFLLSVGAFQAIRNGAQNEAKEFVEALKSGDLNRAVAHFDVNSCHCVAKGGWGSYLVYQSGQEPNLAFLVGHKFQVSESRTIPLNKVQKSWFPWFEPEDAVVNLSLRFDPAQYSPFFLPLPLAYGLNMTWKDFKKFVDDPSDGMSRGLTVRLRNGIRPGSIAADLDNLNARARSRFSFLATQPNLAVNAATSPNNVTADAAKVEALLQSAMKSRPAKYLLPKDSGNVVSEDGSVVPIEVVEKNLPRLSSIIVSLDLTRNGPLHNWAVYRLTVIQPTFTEQDGRKVVNLSRVHRSRSRLEP